MHTPPTTAGPFYTLMALLLIALAPGSAAAGVEVQALHARGYVPEFFRPGDVVRYRVTLTAEPATKIILTGNVTFEDGPRVDLPTLVSTLTNTADEASLFWNSRIPGNAAGEARLGVSVITAAGEITAASACFLVDPEADPDPDLPAYACSPCHSDLFQGWLASGHAPEVGCQGCHGDADAHRAAPGAGNIYIPDDDSCDACHRRNNGTVIEARRSFIAPFQQTNELAGTRHGMVTDCLTCHEPHYSPAKNRSMAIRKTCKSCHPLKQVNLNMQFLDCEDCHMPPMVSDVTSQGSWLYRSGDTASHILRIKPEAGPDQMFTVTGSRVTSDASGSYLSVNAACLYCHNGRAARFMLFDSARQAAPIVH